MVNVLSVYDFGKLLGSGTFGSVRIGHPKNNKNQSYAIKTININKMKGHIDMLNNEIHILKRLDHPNIIKFYEVY